MFKCVSVLVALVCLCNPSIGRSWGGSHDLAYDTKDYNDKSWLADPNDGLHRRSRQGWGQEYDSSEEEPWGKPDYQDYHRGNGYGNDKFDNFGSHYNHEGYNYDHHNHGDYGQHHWPNHQEHAHHNFDNKHDYHGHHGRPESNGFPNFGLPQNNKGNAHNNLRPNPPQNPGSNSKPDVPQNGQNGDRQDGSRNYADQLVFPQDSRRPNLGTTRSPPVASSSTPRSPAVTQSPPTSTTISSLVLQDIVRCIRDCPATPEFNPVCGTNNVTYNNLGALECNRNCGVNVALKRRAPCPQPLPPAYFISVATISTETPIRNAPGAADKNSGSIGRSASEQAPAPLPLANATPTRFTNIDANSEFNIARRANP